MKEWSESDTPTRPLPKFVLADMARALDEARELDGEADQTMTMGPEENRKLLATVFAFGREDADRPSTDDEPTIDALAPIAQLDALLLDEPAPVAEEPRPSRPPPLRSLVLTSLPPKSSPRIAVTRAAALAMPPLSVAATMPAEPQPVIAAVLVAAGPVSGTRCRITPEVAKAAREARAAEARRRQTTLTIRLPERNVQNLVVAGIWATAVSLLAVLMFMATSA